MARRRRKHGSGEQAGPEQERDQKPAPAATTSLGSLLKAAQVAVRKPGVPGKAGKTNQANARTAGIAGSVSAPVPRLPPAQPEMAAAAAAVVSATELRLLNDAYSGALPLDRKPTRHVVQQRVPQSRVSEVDRAEEQAARKRLAALVSGGVHFKIKREDEFVVAYRSEASRKLVDKLGGQGFVAEATLDLHGARTAQLDEQVATFVRSHHRRGARHLLVIVGKGLHSNDGVSVLLPAVIEALTQGLCAPLVRGFATAHQRHGGSGALAVLLV
ncbi:MAG: hypothetical protein RL701_7743 [Pseudomonadota bacterium]